MERHEAIEVLKERLNDAQRTHACGPYQLGRIDALKECLMLLEGRQGPPRIMQGA